MQVTQLWYMNKIDIFITYNRRVMEKDALSMRY